MIIRRKVLFGGLGVTLGAGYLAVERGFLPGRVWLACAVGRCEIEIPLPDARALSIEENQFSSIHRQCVVRWILALPPAPPANLSVALMLHGRGGDARTAFDDLKLHHYLAAHVAGGGTPFAIATVDGGDTYWHPRREGGDALGMIVHELLPQLRNHGLATNKIGVMGWSMGGYGALLMARQSARGALGNCTVVAAAASSPALFPSLTASAPGAFDNASDFAKWGNLLAEPGVDVQTALFVACGDSDAFTAATRRYRETVHPVPAGGISRGCHDGNYWRSQFPAQLAMIGHALAG